MVEPTHLKNISQNWIISRIGVKIILNKLSCHHQNQIIKICLHRINDRYIYICQLPSNQSQTSSLREKIQGANTPCKTFQSRSRRFLNRLGAASKLDQFFWQLDKLQYLKSRWHGSYISVYIDPLFNLPFGICAIYFDLKVQIFTAPQIGYSFLNLMILGRT